MQIKEHQNNATVLKKENDQLKLHKGLLEKEIEELKNELSRVSIDKEKYYEVLVKIKNSFYQTSVYNQLKEAEEGTATAPPAKEGAAEHS